MTSQEIRRLFLDYFKNKNHAVISSSSVVPHDDPTLLFNNAGMNQFKDVFLGKAKRDYTRATTSQKCIRVGGKHNDLDNVGHTSRHLTFFEMLGNFSFGDYFKEQAIQFAWEVSTNVFNLPRENIWATIFENDDEAYYLWQKWLPINRIVRLGEKDNFWAMGDIGPCGPCSELLYDRGEKYGNATSPKEDLSGERYFEFWNLVFMQFNKSANGTLSPLPKQSIDTGIGLERVSSLMMGVESVFATDILRSLIAQTELIFKKTYDPQNSHTAPAFHVIADHIRSLSFAIADGAQPSNIERGYVLRKLIRRAVRYGRTLGMNEPFLAKIFPRLVDLMGVDYPELITAQARICEILTLEEESFIRTLKKGGNILSSIIEKAVQSPMKEITGEAAFKLKDTYGFPLEEILLLAKDHALQVNIETYQLLEEEAKEKSRKTKVSYNEEAKENLFKDFAKSHPPCHFIGYNETRGEGVIIALVIDGQFVNSMKADQEGLVILNRTPFYAEMGGQVGDRGILSQKDTIFQVSECFSPYLGITAHGGTLLKGELTIGSTLEATVDQERRDLIANHHTATHLLHWALEKVLGPHIRQAGSLVESKRLRFDFNHHKSLSLEDLRQVERLVNEKIRRDSPVETYELSYEDVQKRLDIKQFFGEKYSSKVRVVDIQESKELCGGTHVKHLGSIGLFRIFKESGIAAGVRRIEGGCGKVAEDFMYEQEDLGVSAAEKLKTTLPFLGEKLSSFIQEKEILTGQVKNFKRLNIRQLSQDLLTKKQQIGPLVLIASAVTVELCDIPLLTEYLTEKLTTYVIILGVSLQDRCQLFVKVSPDAVQKGIEAVAIIKEVAPYIEGSGGGKADQAQAGGKNKEGFEKAFQKTKQLIEECL